MNEDFRCGENQPKLFIIHYSLFISFTPYISATLCWLYKLPYTLLNRRLVTLDIGNYAVALLARFASSTTISTNQQICLVR